MQLHLLFEKMYHNNLHMLHIVHHYIFHYLYYNQYRYMH